MIGRYLWPISSDYRNRSGGAGTLRAKHCHWSYSDVAALPSSKSSLLIALSHSQLWMLCEQLLVPLVSGACVVNTVSRWIAKRS
jgi:hypothetical protein